SAMCSSMIHCERDTVCCARYRHSFALARQRSAVKWPDLSVGDIKLFYLPLSDACHTGPPISPAHWAWWPASSPCSLLYLKENARAFALASSSERKLGCLQVCRSGLTTPPIRLHIERKLLTLVKIMHASPLDRRNVNEHIRATVVLNDEAVTLLGIEKFNCTCGHNGLLIKRAKASLPIQTIRIAPPLARAYAGRVAPVGLLWIQVRSALCG